MFQNDRKKILREILHRIMRFFSESENGPIGGLIRPRPLKAEDLESRSLATALASASDVYFFDILRNNFV